MGFTIDISGSINKEMDKITAEVTAVIDDELSAFGIDTVAMAKGLCTVDEGFLRNSITFDKPDPLVVEIIVAANYAAYIEFGTRAFAAAYVGSLPPDWQTFAASFKGGGGGTFKDFVRNITEWVKRKGIDQAAAYPIALKIIRFGVRPRPFLYPSIEKNKIELFNNLKAALQ